VFALIVQQLPRPDPGLEALLSFWLIKQSQPDDRFFRSSRADETISGLSHSASLDIQYDFYMPKINHHRVELETGRRKRNIVAQHQKYSKVILGSIFHLFSPLKSTAMIYCWGERYMGWKCDPISAQQCKARAHYRTRLFVFSRAPLSGERLSS
jgi:hypothetical protein